MRPSLLQVEYARGPRFGSILYQGGLSSPAELVGCCFYDPEHNEYLGAEGHRLGRIQLVASNCSSNGVLYGGKEGSFLHQKPLDNLEPS